MGSVNMVHPGSQDVLEGVRISRAAANLPQTGAGGLFNVVGGRVQVVQIVGEVTTVIEAQANATKLTANPTTGTSVDLCATLDITGDEAGTLYGITGVFADVMLGVNAGAVEGVVRPPVVAVGTIDLDCAASNTGQVRWDLLYIPLDDGAVVTAV